MSFFLVTKREKSSLVFMVLLSVGLFFWQREAGYEGCVKYEKEPEVISLKAENEKAVDRKLVVKSVIKGQKEVHVPYGTDPRTCTKEQWFSFGFSPGQAKVLSVYFYNRVYSSQDQIEKITCINKDQKAILGQRLVFSKLNVNGMREEEFQAVAGVGPVLSKRIVKWRDKLGGFASLEQLNMTYGLNDTVFTKISARLVFGKVKTIAVNELSLSELKKHPCISKNEAFGILKERTKHRLSSFNDLKEVFSDSIHCNCIKEYISYD